MYTAEISTYVDDTFTTAAGFSAADRTALKAYLEGTILDVIDPDAAIEEVVQQYTDALRESDYANIETGNPATWQMLLDACEFTVNLVKNDNVPSGFKRLTLRVDTQASTDNPVYVVFQDGIGLTSITRGSSGTYRINFPADTLPALEKLSVKIVNNYQQTSTGITWTRNSAAMITFTVFPWVVDAGSIIADIPDDDLIQAMTIDIEIFPEA